MIVIQLTGSIGNQMFQYAAARNFALIYSCNLLIDSSWFVKNKKSKLKPNKIGLSGFNTSFDLAGSVTVNQFVRKKDPFYFLRYPETKNYKIIQENKKQFTQELYNLNPPFLMQGNFKSETYFEDNIEQIKNDFSIQANHNNGLQPFLDDIINKNSIAVFIPSKSHNAFENEEEQTLNFDYYQQAINLIEQEVSDPYFIFFTDIDEQELDKIEVNSDKKIIQLFENEFEWKNIYLMSKCKHFIADSSSCSWWAAWLNTTNNRTVILPQSFSLEKPEITHNKLGVKQNWIKI